MSSIPAGPMPVPPPPNHRSLADRIRNKAQRENVLAARVQRRLGAVVVAEMLRRIDLGAVGPQILIKGGSALELRLGVGASRTSKDLDAVLRGPMTAFSSQVSGAVGQDLEGFTGTVTRRRTIDVPGMAIKPQGFEIKLQFRGRPYATVPVEVSPPEGLSATEFDLVIGPSLTDLGIPDFPPIPCLSLRYQVAQKLHACTDPLSDHRVNSRARDLVDILLLEPLLPDLTPVKLACVEVFALRATHDWPPTLIQQRGWGDLYSLAASGLQPLVPANLPSALTLGQDLIVRIARS